MQRAVAFSFSLWLAAVAAALSAPAHAEDLDDRIQRMEQELEDLKRELKEQKEAPKAAPAASAPAVAAPSEAASAIAEEEAGEPFYREVLNRVKVGGYGSFRFEHNSLDDIRNTFTLRRPGRGRAEQRQPDRAPRSGNRY
jgi:7-keto-8-aminopelargonate synthetase-like enzyme